MKISNKVYDVMKYVVMIALPAISAFYVALAPVWSWPYAEQVAMTISAVTALLGALLGISSASYKKSSVDEEAM
nr:MAG TPA: holin [Caudoviricetes sp.]